METGRTGVKNGKTEVPEENRDDGGWKRKALAAPILPMRKRKGEGAEEDDPTGAVGAEGKGGGREDDDGRGG